MAVMELTFRAPSLMRNVDISVVIPEDCGVRTLLAGAPLSPDHRFKTLYLLHGHGTSRKDWLMNGGVEELAMLFGVVVVMVDGDNSFYVDGSAPHQKYSQFIGRDVIDFTRRLLPLSCERNDTFIGGLSMGGYGAIYNGLKYFHTFGHIIALSTALIVKDAMNSTDEGGLIGLNRSYFQSIFGDLEKLPGSDKNPEVLAKQTLLAAKAEGLPLDIYIACGWNDVLCPVNREFHKVLGVMGFPHIYEEAPGSHDMAFWREYMQFGVERIIPRPELNPSPFWIEKPDSPPHDG